jgi:hypothetical protein
MPSNEPDFQIEAFVISFPDDEEQPVTWLVTPGGRPIRRAAYEPRTESVASRHDNNVAVASSSAS